MEVTASAGLDTLGGGDPTGSEAVEVVGDHSAAKDTRTRAGVPNYFPSEAVAAVWAYIATSEYTAIQPMSE